MPNDEILPCAGGSYERLPDGSLKPITQPSTPDLPPVSPDQPAAQTEE